MPRFAAPSKYRTMPVNCWNIESRHISTSLSGCVPARPHANLYSSFFKPKQSTPGNHTITSKSENDATLTLSTEADKNYYVRQEVKMGLLMARSKLSQVSEEEGKQGVIESKLVK